MGVKSYAKGVVKEAKRVRWPKRDVLIPSIVVVVIIAVLAGLILFIEDAAGARLISILKDAFGSMGKQCMSDEIRFTDSTTDLTEENANREEKLGDKAWYVVNSYSTHVKKVAENLR